MDFRNHCGAVHAINSRWQGVIPYDPTSCAWGKNSRRGPGQTFRPFCVAKTLVLNKLESTTQILTVFLAQDFTHKMLNSRQPAAGFGPSQGSSYFPERTNWMQWPWFLKPKLSHPPSLHRSLVAGVKRNARNLSLTCPYPTIRP
jgi:hypothetical protein